MALSASNRVYRCNDILCIAPNPTYQITILLDQISLGNVNQAAGQTNSIGGKGSCFATATKQYYMHADTVTLLQILGGHTGARIQAMQDEQGFDHITVKTPLPTRTCITCLDRSTGDMTEMVGVSGAIDESAEAEYEQISNSLLNSEAPPKILALCGTFPPGLRPATVARMISARAGNTLVFVDAVLDIHPVLESKCVDILKVNSSEIISILSAVDRRYEGKTPRDVDLDQAAMDLGSRYSIGTMAVTDGPSTAYLANAAENKCYAFTIPDLLANSSYFLDTEERIHDGVVLNPLGAGDTCNAIFLNTLLEGRPVVEAFALGLAAASASCLVSMSNCVFDRKTMERIRGKMTVSLL
ncbi:hypothetical protein GGI12_003370 [Dipsacomyces acuminosporus]|nr:hypothetical protein GGI12_003370 [Dipsacomyces acuminosporus]